MCIVTFRIMFGVLVTLILIKCYFLNTILKIVFDMVQRSL